MVEVVSTAAQPLRSPISLAPVRKLLLQYPERILTPLWVLLALALWDLIVVLGGVNQMLLPRPWAVLSAFWSGITVGGYFGHLLITGYEALMGFAIAGIAGVVLGAGVALSPAIAGAVYPYLVATQTIPKIALAPLLILWFGYDAASKIAVAALIAFFPVLANVVAGLRDCDEGKLDVLRSLGASRWQIFRMVRLPNALPYVFNGFNIAIVFALTGAIVGEFVGASEGIGYLMMQANGLMNVPMGFSLMLVLALLGAVLFGGMKLIRRRVVYWAADDRLNTL